MKLNCNIHLNIFSLEYLINNLISRERWGFIENAIFCILLKEAGLKLYNNLDLQYFVRFIYRNYIVLKSSFLYNYGKK